MTNIRELWDLALATQQAMGQHIQPIMQGKIEASKLSKVTGWANFGLAYYLHPDALSVEKIRLRNPYSNIAILEQSIQALKDAAYLNSDGVATEMGLKEYMILVETQNEAIAALGGKADELLLQMANYLNRAKDKALSLSELPIFNLLNITRKEQVKDIPHDAFYGVYRLNAFRDDCHLAAWKHLEIEGNVYEAFSLVWDGTADSAATLLETRQYRGYEETDWQTSLDKLVDMAWLEKVDNAYKVTDEGKEIRDEIEVKTDNYFYQAFAGFSDEEIADLMSILKEVQEKFAI